MRVAGAVLAVAALHRLVRADGDHGAPDASYLHDGGAVPLFWIPLAAGYLVDNDVSPRSTPLMFSVHEGGARPSSWEVPPWTITAAGAVVASLVGVASNDRSRWYHAKGLAEALATSSLVVSVAKPVFGRHRPDWTSTTNDPVEAKSFPSGHATSAFVIATYSSLYLHDHVWRDEPLTAPHALAYAGILGGALTVDAERVYHHRHFITDVAAGSLLGMTTSYLIYRYQDARASGARTHDWAVAPSLDPRGSSVSLMGTF